MTDQQNPPTIPEIRDALQAFVLNVSEAREIFAGRLEPDPKGSSWGWDSLRRKIRTALEMMESVAWTPDLEIRAPANAVAALVDQQIPPDVREAVTLHEALGRAAAAADFLVYGAAHLPGTAPADRVSAFSERILNHRDALKAIRERMEGFEGDDPILVVRR